MEHAQPHAHIVPYGTFIKVWLVLLAITAILVITSTTHHVALAVSAMLTLTPIKAALVFYYFMHLKYEKPYLKALVFMVLGLLVLFIGLTFMDISFR